jgi:predicted metal-dependent hydrolase
MPIIAVGEKKVPFILKRSLKAKRLRLEYRLSGLEIVAPISLSNKVILQFLFQQKSWLLKQLAKSAACPIDSEEFVASPDKIEYFKHNVYHSVERYSQLLSKRPKGVYLKTQRRRWGSCGIHDQIYINWVLMYAPREVLDYVVLHECCHLFYRNHGRNFWALVKKHMPNYKVQEKWLRENAYRLDRHPSSFLASYRVDHAL